MSLGDPDDSESYTMQILDNLPNGTKLFGANGVELLPSNGVYVLQPADIDNLKLTSPKDWSTPLQGDIVLNTETLVLDTAIGRTTNATLSLNISVSVTGVADKPASRTVTVDAIEDVSYNLAAALGNLSGIIVDNDSSESLYFVIGGLPPGVSPSITSGDLNYIGGGKWQIDELGAKSLALTPKPNFSGENPYTNLFFYAISQEMDGDQAQSDPWTIEIRVQPVADGFSSWNPELQLDEGDVESGDDISLASMNNYVLPDNDGSESVVWFKLDLSSLIVDAGIGQRLKNLAGPSAGIEELVANYIDGVFTWNSTAKELLVLPGNMNGIALKHSLFFDSNQDFSIPVKALIRDVATIQGNQVTDEKTETGIFKMNLVGTADTPTVFANSTYGEPFTRIPLSIGGTTTDTDVALGRVQSEDIYYIVDPQDDTLLYSFVDSSGAVLGNNNDLFWLLAPADLLDLHIIIRQYSNTTNITSLFTLTTIAQEDDGDYALNSADFNVTVLPPTGGGGNETLPLPPITTAGVSQGNEDQSITLNVTATRDPGDYTNSSVSIVIKSTFPLVSRGSISGAKFNPLKGEWIATAADFAAGLVRITPPKNFAGTMNVTIQAVASTESGLRAAGASQVLSVYVDPVADGVSVSATPATGKEDEVISLFVNATLGDQDGSESLGGFFYVILGNGATFENFSAFTTVLATDWDAIINGTSFVGATRIPSTLLSNLRIIPQAHWHGNLIVTMYVYSNETFDDNDGDNLQVSTL